MLKALFRNRVFFGIFIFGLLVVMGCGLFYGRKVAEQAPVKVYKPVDVEQQSEPKPPPPGETAESGHWHGDEWHSETHETEVSGVASQPPKLEADAEGFADIPPPVGTPADFINPTRTSSNPLFADGVPEHLQCPPELVGVYLNEDKENILPKILPIYEEIMDKWSPDRPIADLWDPMIVADKWYRENADPEKAELFTAAGRLDWLVQQWLNFPEMMILFREDAPRASDMLRVDIGLFSPDWNAVTLPDNSGRIFRRSYDKKYEFTWSTYTEKENGGYTSNTFTYTAGPSNGDPNAEVIEVNLDEVSDAELESLGGWNFNINPYTTGAYKLGDKK